MRRILIITAIFATVGITILVVIGRISKKNEVSNLYSEVKEGEFKIVVSTTGELRAESSRDITGPEFKMSMFFRPMDTKITDLVPEGTQVKAGDYVATLDRSSFDNSLKEELEKLSANETDLKVKMLDTTVTLRGLRNNIRNLDFAVEEAKITLSQSKYEPPAIIRQAEIGLDKAQRAYDQAIIDYTLKVEQARSDIAIIKSKLQEQHKIVYDLQNILSQFIIKAPSDGMVIYKRERNGSKRKIGSSISAWDNIVATLPDMSAMISKTYVNEIDINKVKTGQRVEITVDAFPEKTYTGVVSIVANIGEQLPNADAKVFEVLIKINESDSILKPSMTTGNRIITKTLDHVTYIPLDCIHTGADSIPFVYLKNGNKQIVVLGESNENSAIIKQGLKPGTVVYLNQPENFDRFRLEGKELVPIIKKKYASKGLKEEQINIENTTGSEDLTEKKIITEPVQEVHESERRANPLNPATGKAAIGKDVVVFRVQFASNAKSKGSYDITIGRKVYRTYEYFYDGLYRTCAGEFNTLPPAIDLKNRLKMEGYPNAFIIAFKNNERSLDTNLFK